MKTFMINILWTAVKAINTVKRRLPFSKLYIIADKNNWISINYDLICINSLFSFNVIERIRFIENKDKKFFLCNENFKNEKYKGINLFGVSKYNICVDLDEFSDKIEFSNKYHREIISNWYSLCIECIDFYEKIIIEKKPYKILISQGHNYDSAIVRALSCQYIFGIVAVENTFIKSKIVWDNVSGITVNKNLAKNFFWKYRDVVDTIVADNYVVGYLKNIKKLKSAEHQTPEISVTPSDKKTVLFIGQVYTDASILFGINNFLCPIDILECLINYCEKNRYHLIVKLHPKELNGNNIHGRPYNDLTYRKICQREGLLEKISANGFVLDKGNFDTYTLIEMADVCVTVNSQAGLEALAKGKELIVCGQSFYSGMGFTLEAGNRDSLNYFLDQTLKGGVSVLDQAEINKFLYITAEKYFLEKSEESIKELLFR